MRKYLLLLMLIFMVGTTTMFSACGKEKKVSITIVNETVAEFTFDKEEYVVGDTATFSVTIDDKYYQSNFTVYAKDELLVKDDNGKYSYVLDAENVSFEVKDYTLNTYTYSFDAADFELTTLQVGNITHGESFSFYISTIKYESYVVKVNGVVINPNNGEYCVTNVNSNLNITVEELNIKIFDVVYNCVTGVSIVGVDADTTVVEYGDSVSFDIQLMTGYEKASNFQVLANDVPLTYDNGYTVSNIVIDLEIKVVGVNLITFSKIYATMYKEQ